jgi:hypothetical protein
MKKALFLLLFTLAGYFVFAQEQGNTQTDSSMTNGKYTKTKTKHKHRRNPTTTETIGSERGTSNALINSDSTGQYNDLKNQNLNGQNNVSGDSSTYNQNLNQQNNVGNGQSNVGRDSSSYNRAYGDTSLNRNLNTTPTTVSDSARMNGNQNNVNQMNNQGNVNQSDIQNNNLNNGNPNNLQGNAMTNSNALNMNLSNEYIMAMPYTGLPVLETLVPMNVTEGIKTKFGNLLYDITAVKNFSNQTVYIARVYDNGVYKPQYFDESGNATSSPYIQSATTIQ